MLGIIPLRRGVVSDPMLGIIPLRRGVFVSCMAPGIKLDSRGLLPPARSLNWPAGSADASGQNFEHLGVSAFEASAGTN